MRRIAAFGALFGVLAACLALAAAAPAQARPRALIAFVPMMMRSKTMPAHWDGSGGSPGPSQTPAPAVACAVV